MQEVANRALSPETITRQVLPNGMTVLVYPNPTIPALSARISIKGGAMYDPEGKPGWRHSPREP